MVNNFEWFQARPNVKMSSYIHKMAGMMHVSAGMVGPKADMVNNFE